MNITIDAVSINEHLFLAMSCSQYFERVYFVGKYTIFKIKGK